MFKVLLGEKWDHFGITLDTSIIGIGWCFSSHEKKEWLLSIDLLFLHIYIAN